MLKKLKKAILGASLSATLLFPNNSNADYQLAEPQLRMASPRSTRLSSSEFSTYTTFDYGIEDNFSIDYDLIYDEETHDWKSLALELNYGELSYNPANGQDDFIDGMLDFAQSGRRYPPTPLDGIMTSALSIRQIRNHEFGRFTLNDFYSLFRSYYDMFDEERRKGHIEGDAEINLGGKIDLQQYSNMRFVRNNARCFFGHGTRILAEGSASAGMSYSLDGNGISLGTQYDELLDRSLELSINADFRMQILKSDSYTIGIQEENSSYGLGIIMSDFTRMRGRENAHILVSSQFSEIFTSNRIASLESHERHSFAVEDGMNALLYVFHAGLNGPFWHSGYFGVNVPDYGTRSTTTSFRERMDLTHGLDFGDPATIGRLISGDRNLYKSFDLEIDTERGSDEHEMMYDSPRLDYGIILGLNEGPVRPVLSASRLRGSRFFFNFIMPYAVFNLSTDLTMPHHGFITFNGSNSETLASFLQKVEENSSMPNSAPNAMNDYARLAAYSNIAGPMITFSSENDTLTGSLFYSKRSRYFLELGLSNSSIGSKGLFMRGGMRNFMLTLGYSHLDMPGEDYLTQGVWAIFSGRANSMYYSISARGMRINFSPGNMPPNELNERFRAELMLGGNF